MQIIHVLLLEDNEADARLLQDGLADEDSLASFKITVAERLSEGLEQLSNESFDVVLLDLGLPDSQGLETFKEVTEENPGVPIVVLTGLTDKEMGVNAVSQGAQDYLVKGQVSSDSLERVIRYAIERQRLQDAITLARQNEQRERELRSLAELVVPPATSVPARTFGIKAIHEISEEIFANLTNKYAQLLEDSIEQRTFKVDHRISQRLRDLAMEIGILKGGPRDVIEVHTLVLNNKFEISADEKTQAYIEEGRLLVLELMGHLVTHYRAQASPDAR